MPIKLFPPRPGKTPNFTIRGTYLGVSVDRTAGTPDRTTARKALAKIKDDIERGRLSPKGELTFADAAIAYLRNGGEDTYLAPLTEHFKETPVAEIDQVMIDAAAVKLYPDVTPATRHPPVYTPISAILRHVGVNLGLRRPKGSQGKERTEFLWPEQAFEIFDKAEKLDLEFGIFLQFLCYTGWRLSEALWANCDQLRIDEAFIYLPESKNDEDRGTHIPPVLVEALKRHPRGLGRKGETVFRFRKNGYLYKLLHKVAPRWVGFHTFCHTWATWMRRYGGLDVKGLASTGRWKSEKSAARYAHVVVSEESRKADTLPRRKA